MDDAEKKTKREYDRNIETGKFKDTLFSEDDYDGQMYDFSTFFRFRIPAKATYEGSGLVFVIQNDPRENKALGKCAECMGFGGDISSNMRISPSFAVEFDVVETHEDWDNNMIGINYHGNLESSEQRYPEDRLNNGDVWNVWIDYNDDVFKLYVTTSSVKPLKPLLEKIVQLDTNLTKRFIKKGQDTKIYVGFTSDPGLFPANHDILEWKFRNYHNPFGDAPVVVRGLDQR
jgi:hypothetical protein